MDSEDDMHDPVESLDDDFFSGESNDALSPIDYNSDYGDDNNDHFEDDNNRMEKNFTILKESDIKQKQEDDITSVATVLSLPRTAASILLRHYNWSISKVNDAWFADESKVRTTIGLLEKPVLENSNAKKKKLICGICFETYRCSKIQSTAYCDHSYCFSCWRGYIGTSINDGPGCLMLRCPDPACNAAIDQNMINLLPSDEDKENYTRYLVRSYIEDNKKTKWCPAPDCEYAVTFDGGSENNYDLTCLCSYSFCWNCTEEAHRPVDCGTVSKWILKNSSESENTTWILAYTKPCPKCQRPIEKNNGCSHMTCSSPCKFQFCWLCLGAWEGHVNCNRFKKLEISEKRREMAKNSLERYAHYYERWASNHSSRKKALADLHQMQTVHIKKLSETHCQSESETQLKFITDAWLQIIECRSILKWTYAYGYYSYSLEHENASKKQFFEYLQGEAESGLERLHQCAEQELRVHLHSDGPSEKFNDFRTKLTGLTSVTRNYFENLVRAFENGLCDVDSNAAESSKGKERRKRKNDYSMIDDDTNWSCERCTYANVRSDIECQMCYQMRSWNSIRNTHLLLKGPQQKLKRSR